jgi:DNA-binding CsgD family transcriptional regulator
MSNKPIAILQVRRILQLKSQGKSNRDIALEVHRSRNTVNEYVKLILRLNKSTEELLKLNCICKKEKSLHFIDNFEQIFRNACKQVCADAIQGDKPLPKGFSVCHDGKADPGLRRCT